jgi:membrane-bound lytic murein transglycosylase F
LLKKLLILSSFLGLALLSTWIFYNASENIQSSYPDLKYIKKRGKLIAVTDYNSTNYFVYRGEPMGFHYELLKSFSGHVGIDIEIIAENDLKSSFNMLKSGEADLLAINLTVNSSRKREVHFTDPIDETRQVLVQRKPDKWQTLTADETDRRLIRNQLGLAKKTIYVQKGSSYVERLASLSAEIGDSIKIIEVSNETEKLIREVSEGKIDYTICDENIALVNEGYYRNIDVKTPVSFPQNLAWAVRKRNSDELLNELNEWLSAYKKSGSYAFLYAKYFRNSRSNRIINSDYYALSTGKVSKYDDMIRVFSDSIKWDWRLLAALICQESRFNPTVESRAGAYGLMQVMPLTGKDFGIDVTSSVENNMKAGALYITWLHKIFDPKIPDENERIMFILASYNAGPGHVLDAMKLAEKNGMDPHKWEGNVAVWLMKKYDPLYYNDSVVKSGYFRGNESIAYVSEILERYKHYKNVLPSDIQR